MNTRKRNALLVDDDAIANFLNENIVQSTGLINKTHKARNGKEALSIFNQYFAGTVGVPDIILLDLSMPVMDGFEFIRAFYNIRAIQKQKVVIIIVTSSNNPDDIQKARSMGIKHYLVKPIKENDIRSIIMQEFEDVDHASEIHLGRGDQ